jgi:hypothetical protein
MGSMVEYRKWPFFNFTKLKPLNTLQPKLALLISPLWHQPDQIYMVQSPSAQNNGFENTSSGVENANEIKRVYTSCIIIQKTRHYYQSS